jgi:hypothetical protein
MMAKCARKGADSNPLCLPVLLEAVLAYAGVLEGLYIATVNKSWAECHARMMTLIGEDNNWPDFIYGACYTALYTAFASPARVRFAYDCGFDLDDEFAYDMRWAACKHRHASSSKRVWLGYQCLYYAWCSIKQRRSAEACLPAPTAPHTVPLWHH